MEVSLEPRRPDAQRDSQTNDSTRVHALPSETTRAANAATTAALQNTSRKQALTRMLISLGGEVAYRNSPSPQELACRA
jgi:hypothetical protein